MRDSAVAERPRDAIHECDRQTVMDGQTDKRTDGQNTVRCAVKTCIVVNATYIYDNCICFNDCWDHTPHPMQ